MPRQKEYKEEEVIEKAMELFWRNGYEATSVNMLEVAMGINKFSIYSSFGSKKGVFLESLKLYRSRIDAILNKLESSQNGVADIKQYFYDFLKFSRENNLAKGCLNSNTRNESGQNIDNDIKSKLDDFALCLKSIFIEKLESNSKKEPKIIARQANYLMIAIVGLTTASRRFDQEQLDDYIECTFENI